MPRNQWLDEATSIDLHIDTSDDLTASTIDDLFHNEVKPLLTIKTRPDLFKDALKNLYLNLWIAHVQDKPIRIPRHHSAYSRPKKRYGRPFFSHTRYVPVIDALEALGYLIQRKGYRHKKVGIRRQTRVFPSDKLKAFFNRNPVTSLFKPQPKELIQLRDKPKDKQAPKTYLPYQDKPRTLRWRKNLQQYNEFIGEQDIRFSLTSAFMDKHREKFEETGSTLKHLRAGLLKGMIVPVMDAQDGRKSLLGDIISGGYSLGQSLIYSSDYLYACPTIPANKNQESPVTKTSQGKKVDFRGDNETDKSSAESSPLSESTPLSPDPSTLEFQIRYPFLHRVFSDGSFLKGGRFFGAFHVNLFKPLRSLITINGEPVVELDYEALHLRMLYHMEGIDYREDPYAALCNTPEERKKFKLLVLIALNASNEKEAVQAIRFTLINGGQKDGIKDRDIRGLLDRFKAVHGPIAKYLCSGIGMKLQNKDSKIMAEILTTLTEEGIPALPEHDSVLVPVRHRDRLYGLMMEIYRKHLGFDPVVG